MAVLLPLLMTLGGCAAMAGKPQAAQQDANEAKGTKEAAKQPSEARVAQAEGKPSLLTGQGMFDLLLAEFALQSGNLPLAAEAWKQAAEVTPDAVVLARATRALTQVGRLQDALPLARRWAALAPDQPEPTQYLAALLVSTGQREEGVRLLQRLLERYPERADVYLQLSEILAASGQLSQAELVLQDFVKRNPEMPAAYYALGHLQMRRGQDAAAVEAFRTALAKRPDWDDAALALAVALARSQGDQDASRFLQAYLDKHPGAQDVRLYQAALLLRQQRWDEAYAAYERMRQDQPDNPDVALALGLIDMQRGRWDSAQAQLRRALELAPEQVTARYYLGRLNEERGQAAQALQWYADISKGSLYPEAQLRMARLEHKLGNAAAARARLAALEKQFPDLIQAPLMQAELALEDKQPRQALALINRALARQPRQADLLYQRAAIHERLSDYVAMERDMREVIKLEPRNAHAYNFIGYSLAERGVRLPEAESLLRKALELAPEDPFILDSVGWVLHRQGKSREAEAYLRKALERRPNDPEIATHLGDVLWALGRRDEARMVWRAAAQADPGHAALQERLKQ